MLDPTANNWILPLRDDEVILSDDTHVRELGLEARFRYESAPVWEQMQDFWYKHFLGIERKTLLTTCRTLEIPCNNKASKHDLCLRLKHYFQTMTSGKVTQ